MRIKSSVKNLTQDLSGHMLVCAVVLTMFFMGSSTVWAFNAGSFPDRQTYLTSWKSFLRGSVLVGSARKHHELATEMLATSD